MSRQVIDLTASDDESGLESNLESNLNTDDFQELRVRRVNRDPDPDDIVVISQTRAARPRLRHQSPPLQHMPMLINQETMQQPPEDPPSLFARLGRRARTSAYGPAAAFPGQHPYHTSRPRAHPVPRPAPRNPHYEHFHRSLPGIFTRIFGLSDANEDPDYDPQDDDGPEYPDFPTLFAQMNQQMHNANREHDVALQRAMARSMLETSNREPIDPEKIKKPPMSATSEGYTRDMNEKCDLLCAKCDNLLGEGQDKHALVYFRNCGHVYCGSCVEEIGTLKGKLKRCSAIDCDGKKRQKIVFKQVYI